MLDQVVVLRLMSSGVFRCRDSPEISAVVLLAFISQVLVVCDTSTIRGEERDHCLRYLSRAASMHVESLHYVQHIKGKQILYLQ